MPNGKDEINVVPTISGTWEFLKGFKKSQENTEVSEGDKKSSGELQRMQVPLRFYRLIERANPLHPEIGEWVTEFPFVGPGDWTFYIDGLYYGTVWGGGGGGVFEPIRSSQNNPTKKIVKIYDIKKTQNTDDGKTVGSRGYVDTKKPSEFEEGLEKNSNWILFNFHFKFQGLDDYEKKLLAEALDKITFKRFKENFPNLYDEKDNSGKTLIKFESGTDLANKYRVSNPKYDKEKIAGLFSGGIIYIANDLFSDKEPYMSYPSKKIFPGGQEPRIELYMALLHEMAHYEMYLRFKKNGMESVYEKFSDKQKEEMACDLVNEKIRAIDGKDLEWDIEEYLKRFK